MLVLSWFVAVAVLIPRGVSAQGPITRQAPVIEGVVVGEGGRGLVGGLVVVSWLENVVGDFPPVLATVEVRTTADGRFSTAATTTQLSAFATFVGLVVYVPEHRPMVLTQPASREPLRVRLQRYDQDAEASSEAIGGAILGLGRAWAARDPNQPPAALAGLRRDWERLPAESHATVLQAWKAPDDFDALFRFWAQEFRGARDRIYLERR